MNFKAISIFSFATFFFITSAFSQISEADIKKAITSAIAIQNAKWANHGMLTIPLDYVMADGKLLGQNYMVNSFSTSYKGGNIGFAHAELTVPGDKIAYVYLEAPGCTFDRIDIAVGGDVVEFNATGQPVLVMDPRYSKRSKDFMKRKYVLEYKGDKLSKVSTYEVYADGKSMSSAKVREEVRKVTTDYIWLPDGKLQVDIEEFRPFKKKNNIVGYKSTILYAYAQNLVTVDKQTGDAYKSEAVKEGNELRVTYSRGGSISSKEVCTLEDGKIVKREVWEFNSDSSFKSHILSKLTYVLKEPHFDKANLCSHNVEAFTSKYDATGIVIEESTGGKGRIRNADGTWGEWFTYRM